MDFRGNQIESRFNNVFAAYKSHPNPDRTIQYQRHHPSPYNKFDILQQWLDSLPQPDSLLLNSHMKEEEMTPTACQQKTLSYVKPNSICSSSTSSDELNNNNNINKQVSITTDWIARWLQKNKSARVSHTACRTAAEQQKALVTSLLEKSLAAGSQIREQSFDKKRFKTELCRRYFGSDSRQCEYADKCQFAHSLSELRLVQRHPKYKTEVCLAYQNFKKNQGSTNCAYGSRCHFIHDETTEEVAAIRLRMELYSRYKAKQPDAQDVVFSDVIEKLNLLDL